MKPIAWMSLGLFLLGLLTACGQTATGLSVSGAWVRPAPMMERAGAAYFVITNATDHPDRLLAVTTEAATSVEMHETKMEGGLMSMSPIEFLDIPANGQVELKPGGYHLMLIGLTREFKAGEEVTLVLTFETAGEITVTADVQEE